MSKQPIPGLDSFVTTCRATEDLIDPQIILEAHCGRLSVRVGHWTIQQARAMAELINATCDAAEAAITTHPGAAA